MNPTPDPYSVPALVQTGLTQEEAHELAIWVNAGKPGIASSKASGFAALYAMGFEVSELATIFNEYPRPTFLYAFVRDNWPGLRQRFRDREQRAQVAVAAAKHETMTMVSQLLQATSYTWKEELLRYLANPAAEKRPSFLPQNMKNLKELVEVFAKLTEKVPTPPAPPVSNPTQVNVGAGGTATVVVTGPGAPTPLDVKAALMAERNQPLHKPS